MHEEARAGFAKVFKEASEVGGFFPVTANVLDIGGHDNNGSVHDLLPDTFSVTVLDMVDEPDVHIVADATVWEPDDNDYDMVICTEVFEHVENWPAIVATAHKALRPGGIFVTTMAGLGRPEHGALGAALPAEGEWYENVLADDLDRVLEATGFSKYNSVYNYPPGDLYAWAIK